MRDTFPCPRCNYPLDRSGSITWRGREMPVFQCDSCRVNVELFGKTYPSALTFAVNKKGRAFDPASHDGELPPPAAAPS
jgi:hypothetical protein